ncbi:isochorismate synthase MenF [Lacisediminihabitans sp. H27-G8]|uniref:isochorismate synthase n=1 Tax=Lacisediminihabitans sp. H27-G8 TaxID=3111909 RepID=UPI0038FC361A
MTASAPFDDGAAVPSLTVETTPTADLGPLVPLLEARHPLLWMRRGFGLVGHGEALRLEFCGPDRVRDAAIAWQRISAAATVTDPLARTGTGLLAFGSFAFSDSSATTSVLLVPSMIIGRDKGQSWITRIAVGELEPLVVPPLEPYGQRFHVDFHPGTVPGADYRDAVATAVQRIRSHEVSKVVLARELVGQLPDGADIRRMIDVLAAGYPDCWTFAVDGFIGSSPETLVTVDAGSVTARVLAGSAARGLDAASDEQAASALATSTKDQDEHRYAVQNVLASLRSHSPNVMASEMPFTLKLPNVWHLASDIEGDLTDGSTSLDLIGSLHPTAAVAGTPTPDALRIIGELEPFDRGRYAGPVGWVGADGDGEWAVAVRSAQFDQDGRVTAYAGAGIVAESVPERELLETRMKFRPIVEALD